MRLWLEAIDSRLWNWFAATGSVQDGKTFNCILIPLLYHLFELKEDVIFGVPRMDMAHEKWKVDILPAIQHSSFRNLLPSGGRGSRGGFAELLEFKHGPTLRFMSGHGGDETRSGATARAIFITEADKMEKAGGTSREASPIYQLISRARSFTTDERVIYEECTTSFEKGEIWQRTQEIGTASKIVMPCPHCSGWVTLEREQLTGWREATSVRQARREAKYICPACAAAWDEDERLAANRQAKLLHRDQTIGSDGEIHGDPPDTDTLGFRWNAANSVFKTAGDCGGDEWSAERAADRDASETDLRQFIWVLPVEPSKVELYELNVDEIVKRTTKLKRGIVPADTVKLAVGIDLRTVEGHYTVVAWRASKQRHLVEYGTFKIAGKTMAVDRALYLAVEAFLTGVVLPGWQKEGGGMVVPGAVWVDANWQGEERGTRGGAKPVYQLSRKYGVLTSVIGRGAGVYKGGNYSAPDKRNKQVRFIGDGYHGVVMREHGIVVVQADTDTWKVNLQHALHVPLLGIDGSANPGAITLHSAGSIGEGHRELSRHLTAETPEREWVDDRGFVIRWKRKHHANHWLDSTTLAIIALDSLGCRVIDEPKPKRTEWGKGRLRARRIEGWGIARR